MSFRRCDDSVKLTATLTGMSLAVSIAREATDAVPAVKQSLGAVVRILALAEKIDKDREALHALAGRSLQLAERVKDVMDQRTPDAKIMTSLERINRAFDSIEAFMMKHTRHTRLRRAIGYVFTVPQHVDRLSRQLADAVKELVLVALLDLNNEAHATRRSVVDEAQYAGEFRLLRHCDVDKLDRLDGNWPGSNMGVRYHRARVGGQLVVVRYLDATESHSSSVVQRKRQALYEDIISQDRMIKELSTVQRSHLNIARIYGWSKGSIHNRFTVFKSGFREVYELSGEQLPNLITTLLHCAFKVLAAVHHLKTMGIDWNPAIPPYALDEHLEPTIGLRDDLCSSDSETDPVFRLWIQVFYSTSPMWEVLSSQGVAASDVKAAVADPHNEQLNNVLGRFESVQRVHWAIPKAEFSTQILNDDTAEGLLVVGEEGSQDGWQFDSQMWATILLALDNNRGHRIKNGFKATYTARTSEEDSIRIHALDEDSEQIVYDRYWLSIPDAQRDEIREMFNIPAPSEEEHRTSYIIATGAYHAPQ